MTFAHHGDLRRNHLRLERRCDPLCLRQPQSKVGHAGLFIALKPADLHLRRHPSLQFRHQLHPPHQLRHQLTFPRKPKTYLASNKPHRFVCSRDVTATTATPNLAFKMPFETRRRKMSFGDFSNPLLIEEQIPRPVLTCVDRVPERTSAAQALVHGSGEAATFVVGVGDLTYQSFEGAFVFGSIAVPGEVDCRDQGRKAPYAVAGRLVASWLRLG